LRATSDANANFRPQRELRQGEAKQTQQNAELLADSKRNVKEAAARAATHEVNKKEAHTKRRKRTAEGRSPTNAFLFV
jgi:hypothetical protein